MQVLLSGTNNKGETLYVWEHEKASYMNIVDALESYQRTFPEAISVNIQIAYPDPEVVAIKNEIRQLLKPVGQTTDDIVEALWNRLDIKWRK